MGPNTNSINDYLSPELIWTIFYMNATHEDVTIKERLYNTISSSLVCKTWRSLLLDIASIWAHLIYVEHKKRQKDEEIEMMHEILRRSGESPLYVHAILRAYRSGGAYLNFLDHVLSNYWERIVRLDMRIFVTVREAQETAFLSMLTRSAPRLRSCHIELSPSGAPIDQGSDYDIGLSPPLFGNAAPNLRYLRSDHLAISPQAPWLSTLTTLITTYRTKFTSSIPETLFVLARLPKLSHLQLGHHLWEHVPDLASISTYPSAHLPNLEYFGFGGTAWDCMALLERVHRPKECLVNADININHDEPEHSEAIAEQLFEQTFSRNLEIKDPLGHRWLFIDIHAQGMGVTLADKHCFAGTAPTLDFQPIMSSEGSFFSFDFSFLRDVDEDWFCFMNSLFRSTIMHKVETLRLIASPFAPDDRRPSMRPLILNTVSVRTLEIDIQTLWHIKNVYCKGTDDNEEEDPSLDVFLLPSMDILHIHLVGPDGKETGTNVVFNLLAAFFKARQRVGQRQVTSLHLHALHPDYWEWVLKNDARMNSILLDTAVEYHDAYVPQSWG